MKKPILVLLATLMAGSSTALARPQYAAKEKLNCIACHASPWGGGPRTVQGKLYGAMGFAPGAPSQQSLYAIDLRSIAYYATSIPPAQATQGIATMEGAASANVPVIESDAGSSELRGVLTYNVSPLAGAELREGYARYFVNPSSPRPMTLLVGHFNAPFGLLTDEHRTYARIQTGMTLNQFDSGLAFSFHPIDDVQADLAVVNDFQSGGSFTSGDLTLGAVLNLRWNPSALPFMLGVSGCFERSAVLNQPYAFSVYALLSMDRLVPDSVSGFISLERVDAVDWNGPQANTGGVNPSLDGFFIPASDMAYQAAVSQSSSVGYSGTAWWNSTRHLAFFYKLDYLALDAAQPQDAFVRHGFGLEWRADSNLILNARFEKAVVGRPEIAGTNVLAAQDDVFAMLRLLI